MYLFRANAIFNGDDSMEELGNFERNNVFLKKIWDSYITEKYNRKCSYTISLNVIFT